MNKIIGGFGLVFCLLLAACRSPVMPGEYESAEVGKLKTVVPGVVISIREVQFHSRAATNSKRVPGSEYMDGGQGYEYVIKLKSGKLVSIAQPEKLKLKVKQHVFVVYGKRIHVLPDEGSS